MEIEQYANTSDKVKKITYMYHLIEYDSKNHIAPDFFKPEFLQAAFDEAIKANKDGEVPVGCVFVKDKPIKISDTVKNTKLFKNEQQIISRGRNTVNKTKNATRHAEINCIDDVHYSICKGK